MEITECVCVLQCLSACAEIHELCAKICALHCTCRMPQSKMVKTQLLPKRVRCPGPAQIQSHMWGLQREPAFPACLLSPPPAEAL